MQYFWCTKGNIPDGLGFKLFDITHICWLIALVVISVLLAIWYKKLGDKGRRTMLIVLALLAFADEIFKHVGLLITDSWSPAYLPLHFCSINIFMMLFDSIKPNKFTKHCLIIFGLPGALAALIFCSWTKLPALNFMHIHSETVHMLIVIYPILCLVDGRQKPNIKHSLMAMGTYIACCVPLYFVDNYWLDTNFFFLKEADGIPPLVLSEKLLGNHIYALPIVGIVIVSIMYLIWWLITKEKWQRQYST